MHLSFFLFCFNFLSAEHWEQQLSKQSSDITFEWVMGRAGWRSADRESSWGCASSNNTHKKIGYVFGYVERRLHPLASQHRVSQHWGACPWLQRFVPGWFFPRYKQGDYNYKKKKKKCRHTHSIQTHMHVLHTHTYTHAVRTANKLLFCFHFRAHTSLAQVLHHQKNEIQFSGHV